jgi:hypothetical protein
LRILHSKKFACPAFTEVCLASAQHPCAYRNKMSCSRVLSRMQETAKGVLRVMPFVVLAVLGVAVVLSLVFMMYVLARPWL